MGSTERNVLELMEELDRQAQAKVQEFVQTFQAATDWLEDIKRQAAELTSRSAKNPFLLPKTPTIKRGRKRRSALAAVEETPDVPAAASRTRSTRGSAVTTSSAAESLPAGKRTTRASNIVAAPTSAPTPRNTKTSRASRAVSILDQNATGGTNQPTTVTASGASSEAVVTEAASAATREKEAAQASSGEEADREVNLPGTSHRAQPDTIGLSTEVEPKVSVREEEGATRHTAQTSVQDAGTDEGTAAEGGESPPAAADLEEACAADGESEGEERVVKEGRKAARATRSVAGTRKRSRASSPRPGGPGVAAAVRPSPVPAPRTHVPSQSTSTDSETEMTVKPAKPVRATRSKQKRSVDPADRGEEDRPSKVQKIITSESASSEPEPDVSTEDEGKRRMTRTISLATVRQSDASEEQQPRGGRSTRTKQKPIKESPAAATGPNQTTVDTTAAGQDSQEEEEESLMVVSGTESSAEEEQQLAPAVNTTITVEKDQPKRFSLSKPMPAVDDSSSTAASSSAAESDRETEKQQQRSARTKQRMEEVESATSGAESDSQPDRGQPTRSARSNQRMEVESASSGGGGGGGATDSDSQGSDRPQPSRSTRTKQRQVDTSAAASTVPVTDNEEAVRPVRSTRTKQRQLESSQQPPPPPASEVAAVAVKSPPPPAGRSTRTKQRLIQQEQQATQDHLTRSAASPRVRELAQRALSPATKGLAARTVGGSPHSVPYTGSPVRDRVKQYENAMRESAGLRPRLSGVSKARRSSSVTQHLRKISAAKRTSIARLVAEQLPLLHVNGEATGNSSMSSTTTTTSPPLQDQSRGGGGGTVRPQAKRLGRVNSKVMASGGRGVSPAVGSGKSMLSSGSSSQVARKFKSRIDMIAKAAAGTPSNMIKDPAIKSFLPPKPKAPTMEEIQEMKEEERRRKEEREEEARRRREELMKKKAEEQREKREERIRRVQEARQISENQRENRIRSNQARENEEKLAALKKREERQKEEAEKKRREAELRMRQAEERRRKEDEEKRARAEEEARLREEEKKKRQREEEERRQEQQRREEARILREREELRRIKEREAEKAKENMNSTYSKPADATVTLEKTVNTTYQLDNTQAVDSYDMTPARHELPPEPSKNEDDYGIDDLQSDQDTDDDENPRKQIPKWAEGGALRTALLKQSYMPPDLDLLFELPAMPDLTRMFATQRKRFYKRTSSACWDVPPTSFKHAPS